MIMQAAFGDAPFSPEFSRRLWSVFRALVEIEYGDRMNEAREREAIALAGHVAAEIDLGQSLKGDKSMHERLSIGLVTGTTDSDAFTEGYKRSQFTKLKIS